MDSFTQHKEDRDIWYSPPFYSRPGGYKMCLVVYASGKASGTDSHLSVYIDMVNGENDGTLVWPYQGSVVIEVISWKDSARHVAASVDFSDTVTTEGNGSGLTGEDSTGWGCPKFLSHKKLYDSDTEYVHNDTLYFKCTIHD